MTKVGSNVKRSVDIRREGLHSLEGEKGIFLSDRTKLKNDELFFWNYITSQLNQLNKQCQGISILTAASMKKISGNVTAYFWYAIFHEII